MLKNRASFFYFIKCPEMTRFKKINVKFDASEELIPSSAEELGESLWV